MDGYNTVRLRLVPPVKAFDEEVQRANSLPAALTRGAYALMDCAVLAGRTTEPKLLPYHERYWT